MKAVLLDEFGGPERLRLGDVPSPAPADGQVRIRVAATSVNRPDIVQREGHYPPPKGESEILGLEVAGTIDELGPGVSGWEVGDRVMTLVGGGGYAEYALAYADHLLCVPDSMSNAEAACVCETYITAYLNVFRLGGLRDGQNVLLHGGGGGVNTAAIQLCRRLTPDARIMVTASAGKLERVRGLGAHLVVDYRAQDFAEAVREFTDRAGAHVILDHIGATYLARNMKALGVGGTLVIIGVMGGAKAELNLALMMVKRQRIIGSVLRSRPRAEKAGIIDDFRSTVLPLLAERRIVPLLHAELPLAEVRRAHEMMEAGEHFGKIALRVAETG
jgi:putative PIG3 family NAD(P)H quinone oxidoreductase